MTEKHLGISPLPHHSNSTVPPDSVAHHHLRHPSSTMDLPQRQDLTTLNILTQWMHPRVARDDTLPHQLLPFDHRHNWTLISTLGL